MGSVVTQEFGKIEEIQPIGLEVVREETKVLFDGLVGAFHLTVDMRVEDRRVPKAGAKEEGEFSAPG